MKWVPKKFSAVSYDLKNVFLVGRLSFLGRTWPFEMKARLKPTTRGASICHDGLHDKPEVAGEM
jgi:hypothetical protein